MCSTVKYWTELFIIIMAWNWSSYGNGHHRMNMRMKDILHGVRSGIAMPWLQASGWNLRFQGPRRLGQMEKTVPTIPGCLRFVGRAGSLTCQLTFEANDLF